MWALLQLTDCNDAVVLASVGLWPKVKPAAHPFLVLLQFKYTQRVVATQCHRHNQACRLDLVVK